MTVIRCKLCGLDPAVYKVDPLRSPEPSICEPCHDRLRPRPPPPAPPPARALPKRRPCHVDWWRSAPPAWRRGFVFALRASGARFTEIAALVGLTPTAVKRYDDIATSRMRREADRRFKPRQRPWQLYVAARTGHLDYIGRGL